MSMPLNYNPSDVVNSDALVVGIAGGGMAFAVLPASPGVEPETVAIGVKLAQKFDLRVGQEIELGYVPNYEEHAGKVPYRAVAIYRDVEKTEKPKNPHGRIKAPGRVLIDKEVRDRLENAAKMQIWSVGTMYRDLFDEVYDHNTAEDGDNKKYKAVKEALEEAHRLGLAACCTIYGREDQARPVMRFYAKSSHDLRLVLMDEANAWFEDEDVAE